MDIIEPGDPYLRVFRQKVLQTEFNLIYRLLILHGVYWITAYFVGKNVIRVQINAREIGQLHDPN